MASRGRWLWRGVGCVLGLTLLMAGAARLGPGAGGRGKRRCGAGRARRGRGRRRQPAHEALSPQDVSHVEAADEPQPGRFRQRGRGRSAGFSPLPDLQAAGRRGGRRPAQGRREKEERGQGRARRPGQAQRTGPESRGSRPGALEQGRFRRTRGHARFLFPALQQDAGRPRQGAFEDSGRRGGDDAEPGQRRVVEGPGRAGKDQPVCVCRPDRVPRVRQRRRESPGGPESAGDG